MIDPSQDLIILLLLKQINPERGRQQSRNCNRCLQQQRTVDDVNLLRWSTRALPVTLVHKSLQLKNFLSNKFVIVWETRCIIN